MTNNIFIFEQFLADYNAARWLSDERQKLSNSLQYSRQRGRILTMEMWNSNKFFSQKKGKKNKPWGWDHRDGANSQSSQPAHGYLRRRPGGNTLGRPGEKGGITDNEQTRPSQAVLTLKRKSRSLWNPNEPMRGLRTKHTPMPLPMNRILRC